MLVLFGACLLHLPCGCCLHVVCVVDLAGHDLADVWTFGMSVSLCHIGHCLLPGLNGGLVRPLVT